MSELLPVRRLQPRRRGTDETSAWVRSLRLRLFETSADGRPRPVKTDIPAKDVKHVLLTIAQYVDQNGVAWPGFQTLADDTEMSWDSIRRRIADAEYLRLIVRVRRWRDDDGAVNYDGRGRETSGEIRFVFDTTQDELDELLMRRRSGAAAADESGDDVAGTEEAIDLGCAASPPRPETLGWAGSAPGVRTRCTPYEPLTEPKNPPQSPPAPESSEANPQAVRGEREPRPDDPVEVWLAEFKRVYPKPSNYPDRVASTARTLSPDERNRALVGARGVRAYVDAAPPSRKPSIKAPERFLADPMRWTEYARFAPPEQPPPVWVVAGSPEWSARSVLAAIRRRPMPRQTERDGTTGAWFARLPAYVLALGRFAEIPREAWPIVDRNTVQWTRWTEWLRDLGVVLEAERERVPGQFSAHRDASGRPFEAPVFRTGARLPDVWPPAKGDAGSAAATGPPASGDRAGERDQAGGRG